jgi:broad specificity phosphatase PhoE
VRIFVLSRHGQSTLNVENKVNGDPTADVPLTADGRVAATKLGEQVAHLPLDLGVHTRFARTRETIEIALARRGVPTLEEPLLDDIDIGDLEGCSLDDYRAWKHAHTRSDSFPGGESLDDAARRYARAFRALLARPEQRILVVCHEIPVRYVVNAGTGSDELDGPLHYVANAAPYVFDDTTLRRAVERIRELAG